MLLYISRYILILETIKGPIMTVISQDGRFEWGSEKDELNIKNHGFSFSEILEVFDDPYLLTKFDDKNSSLEEDRVSAASVEL